MSAGKLTRAGLTVIAAALLAATAAAGSRSSTQVQADSAMSITTAVTNAIGRNTATVQVTISASEPGQWELDYGTSTSYGQSLGRHGFTAGTETMTFMLQRLLPGTTYHFHAVAMTPSFPPFTGNFDSGDKSFTTSPPAKPRVTIRSVTGVADCRCAVVQAGFYFGGLDTRIHAEFGVTRRLGHTADAKSFPEWDDVGGQGLAQQLDIPANGRLQPGKYYVRVVATNKLGTAASPIETFTIPSSR
jgi:hypothetical protein